MNDKKQYTAPEMKVVEFKVEKGFAISQSTTQKGTRGTTFILTDGSSLSGFHPSGGYFGGSNDDWD